MSSRERMMIALRNGQPDRVPVAPDISNMIPARLTGRPFWDIYYHEDPPLWRAYLDAIDYFDMDGWFTYGDLGYQAPVTIPEEQQIISQGPERWTVRTTYHTPAGDLTLLTVYPRRDPPTVTEKLVKNFPADWPKLRYLLAAPVSYDPTLFQEQKKALGERGIMCVGAGTPGFHVYHGYFHGNVEAATYAYYDYPDLFAEMVELDSRRCVRAAEMAIDAGADSILTGGSGSITLQSPAIWRKISLPTLKRVTRLCKEAGVISGVHSCGKERYLVQVCAEETDLDYVNPLEIPPMGDCTLAECKRLYGRRLALMGNLHTTEVMLCGTPQDVRRESLQAILDAGQGGGFVLSTGDQCGRDTPDENIRAMVQAAKEWGQYPLDMAGLQAEIERLARQA